MEQASILELHASGIWPKFLIMGRILVAQAITGRTRVTTGAKSLSDGAKLKVATVGADAWVEQAWQLQRAGLLSPVRYDLLPIARVLPRPRSEPALAGTIAADKLASGPMLCDVV